LQLQIAMDEKLMIAWAKSENGERLEPLEQRRLLQIVSSYLIGFENLYFQYRAGMVEDDSYEARKIIISRMLSHAGAMEWWESFGREQHPAIFVEEVERILASTKAPLTAPAPASQ
jgi:hypothetical protein